MLQNSTLKTTIYPRHTAQTVKTDPVRLLVVTLSWKYWEFLRATTLHLPLGESVNTEMSNWWQNGSKATIAGSSI